MHLNKTIMCSNNLIVSFFTVHISNYSSPGLLQEGSNLFAPGIITQLYVIVISNSVMSNITFTADTFH